MSSASHRIARSAASGIAICLAISSLTAAPVRFDFNAPGSATQPGWHPADEGNGSAQGVAIATVAFGGVGLQTRDRGNGNANVSGSDWRNNDMWRDFVFASGSTSAAPGTGLEITISGLSPGKTYPLRIWAFDDGSNASGGGSGRSADWTAGIGSATLTFPSGPDPSSLASYTVLVNGTANAGGVIVLTGTVAASNPDASHNVFINGLEVGNYFGDEDGDGMQDAFELDIVNADPGDGIASIDDVLPGDDFDSDGVTNEDEETRGTNPIDDDTDGDGLFDGVENGGGLWIDESSRGTNPLVADSDDDGLADGLENFSLPHDPNNPLDQPGTNPNTADTDMDGASDFREVTRDLTDPTDAFSVFDPTANAVAMFDFGPAGSPVQADWAAADLGVGISGGVSVTTEALSVGTTLTLDSRDRGAANTDGADADVAHADMWGDFIFANGSNSASLDSGLRITISGLLPSTTYSIRIFGFDDVSGGGRKADWGVSGQPVAGSLGFPDGPDPVSLVSYMVDFDADSDGSGQIVLDGVSSAFLPGPAHNVFVNGLVVALPGPSGAPRITDFMYDPGTGAASITWDSIPDRNYKVEVTFDFQLWIELTDNFASQGNSTTYTDTSFGPSDGRWYRVELLP